MASKLTTAQRVENARQVHEKASAKLEKIKSALKGAQAAEKEAQAAYDELLELQAAEQRDAFLAVLREELASRNLSAELTPTLANSLIAAYAQTVEPSDLRDETPRPADSPEPPTAPAWIVDRN